MKRWIVLSGNMPIGSVLTADDEIALKLAAWEFGLCNPVVVDAEFYEKKQGGLRG